MSHGGGHGGPVNDTAREKPGAPEGALLKDAEDKGSSPHMTKDTAPGAGGGQSTEPTADRNMTMLRQPALPGAVVRTKG